MIFEFYNDTRLFLEKMISENPDNAEFVKAYITLLTTFADADIKHYEQRTDYNKDRLKSDSEITKQQIDKGIFRPLPSWVSSQ